MVVEGSDCVWFGFVDIAVEQCVCLKLLFTTRRCVGNFVAPHSGSPQWLCTFAPHRLQVLDPTTASLADVIRNFIAAGRPVLVKNILRVCPRECFCLVDNEWAFVAKRECLRAPGSAVRVAWGTSCIAHRSGV